MATGKALDGKSYAGNPHVWFDEGEVASAAAPRRVSLLYNSKTLMSTGIVSLALSFAAMRSFALPSSLAHRWSFNTDDKDEITGAEPASRFGTRSLSDGKVHFLGNGWGGGSLNLGTGLLGSGDVTVEIWATQDAVRYNSIIFTCSGGYGG